MTENNERLEELQDNTKEAVDMKGFEKAAKDGKADAGEREVREAAKKDAPMAKKEDWTCTTNIKSDNKLFAKGDFYVGKLYSNLVDRKTIVKTKEWEKR